MSGFQLQRLGQIMEPEPGNPREVEGTLNPAAVRGPDGQLYLFPRLVARGNYSRIGIARVRFNDDGNPAGIERLGIAIEPEADYERRSDGSGGCEDPRITFVAPLQRYVMTYAALSSIGPRIALAISEDLFHWKRLGLATFDPYYGIDFVHVDNKDASVFPVLILLWTMCGFGALIAGAWLFGRPFGNVGLGAARMLGIVAIARCVGFLSFSWRPAEFLVELLLAAVMFFILAMLLFRLKPRDAATQLVVTIVLFLALFVIAHLVTWVT